MLNLKDWQLDILPAHWSLTPVLEKRPLRSGWQDEPTIERDRLLNALDNGEWLESRKGNRWFARWDGIGLRTGTVSGGLMAIDVDGPTAAQLYTLMSGQDAGETVAWTSGKAGRRQELYQLSPELQARLESVGFTHYALKDWQGFSCDAEADEQLDFRFNRSQSVLPPSKHPTTGAYRWINSIADTEVSAAPQWIEQFLLDHCDRLAAEKADRERVAAERAEYRRLNPLQQSDDFNAQAFLDAIDPNLLGWYEWRDCLLAAHASELDEHTVRAWSSYSAKHSDHGFNDVWKAIKGKSGGLTAGTLYHYAKQQGYSPKPQPQQQAIGGDRPSPIAQVLPRSTEQGEPDPISYAALEAELTERAAAAESVERHCFSHDLAGFLGRIAAKATQALGFAPIKVNVERRKPDVTFEPGKRLETIQQLRRQGFKHILDVSGTGGQKSTTAGEMDAQELSVERLIYLSESSRKPSTIEVERRYSPLPIRNDGMVRDRTQTTPGGEFVMRWPEVGNIAETDGNCFQAKSFHQLASKNIDVYAKGNRNPICDGCPALGACMNSQGPGYGFLSERREAMAAAHWRANPMSLNSAGSFDFSNTGLLWDESGKILEFSKDITVKVADFDLTMAAMELARPDLHKALLPLRANIRPLLTGEESIDRYGLSTAALLERLGTMPEEIGAIIPELANYYADLNDLEFLADSQDSLDSSEESKAIASLKGKLARRKQKAQSAPHDEQELLELEIVRLTRELQKLEAERDQIKLASKKLQTQERIERRQRLTEQVEVRWLVPFLKRWAGLAEYSSFHIQAAKGQGDRISPPVMTITERENRYSQIARTAAFNIYLDATETRQRLAQKLGINEARIIVIQQRGTDLESQYRDLSIIQIDDMGRMGKQRSQGLVQRLDALTDFLRQKHPDIAVIDHKAMAPGYWWFNHSRGTNELQARSALLTIGTPCENIAALEAKYIALTGTIPTGKADPDFRDYVEECIDSEFIQAAGRLRAILRPGQKLTYYVVTNHPLPPEMGAVKLKARDLTIEAGTPAEQQWDAISGYLMNLEVMPTQAQLSEALGIVQGQISKLAEQFIGGWRQLKKIFQTLLEPHKRMEYFWGEGMAGPKPDPERIERVEVAIADLEEMALSPAKNHAEDMLGFLELLGEFDFQAAISRLDLGFRILLAKGLLGSEVAQ